MKRELVCGPIRIHTIILEMRSCSVPVVIVVCELSCQERQQQWCRDKGHDSRLSPVIAVLVGKDFPWLVGGSSFVRLLCPCRRSSLHGMQGGSGRMRGKGIKSNPQIESSNNGLNGLFCQPESKREIFEWI